MRIIRIIFLCLALLLTLSACASVPERKSDPDAVTVHLDDNVVRVQNQTASTDTTQAVYTAHDIIYYEENQDFRYGEGSPEDAHSRQEAQQHTVVHITKPGTYLLSGKLSHGQIAIDLGEDAKSDPEAVVTLILNGVDIHCDVAPAVIFYRVYECADADETGKDVDTHAAGARVILADGSENRVYGSYVAKIYQPESILLNEDQTEVTEAKKLHKYDGAFYSCMSMHIAAEEKGTGTLHITAENEGLGSEMHLTIDGGNILIRSGNDGINTNEDGVSVTTLNAGIVTIEVTGETGEGDGIDSNGYLVIRGGTLIAAACSDSADAGIDSDLGIFIEGGTVLASGNMLDRIEDSGQTYVVFQMESKQEKGTVLTLQNSEGKILTEYQAGNAFSTWIFSSPELESGDYTLRRADELLYVQKMQENFHPGTTPGGKPGEPPEGFREERPSMGEDFQGKPDPFQGEPPLLPEGSDPMQKPNPAEAPNALPGMPHADELTSVIPITYGANLFRVTDRPQ